MIKRIVILLLALCVSIVMKSHPIMNADMAFTLVAGIGFLIMAAWTCFHSSIPNKEKFRVFMKFIPEPLVIYMFIGGTAFALSTVSDLDFWMICRFAAIFYVILGNHTIRYRKKLSPDVTHCFETNIDGSSRTTTTSYEKHFEGSAEGLKSIEDFISEIKNGSLKEDKSFEQFMREIKADSSMEDFDFEEIFRKLFD